MNENEFVIMIIQKWLNFYQFDIHFATECKQDYVKAKAEKNKFCEASKCKTRLLSLNTYNCDNCGKQLCLA